MKKVKVKICGITNLEDALGCAKAGADALGFVFYKKSRRYISPQKAARISRALPPGVLKVGVFVDANESRIKKIARECRLDILQFHGKETPAFCARFKGHKVIKAFGVKETVDSEGILDYNTFGYLFDSSSRAKKGGTGRPFDWRLVRGLIRRPCNIFLSGGLSVANIRQAIKIALPDWVDASSSLELCPGRKNLRKVSKFIKKAKARYD